jgi:hypothetical protein
LTKGDAVVKRILLALMVVGLLLTPTVAQAGMLGATVDLTWYYPNSATVYCGSGSAIVGGGVEYPSGCSGFAAVSVDIADSQLTVVNSSGTWDASSFNGFRLSVLSGPEFASASYGGGTMDVFWMHVADGDLWLNFAGESAGTAYINFTTQDASNVPDPGSSLLMLCIGLVGLRAWRKRPTQ